MRVISFLFFTGCIPAADVIFLLDGSDSISLSEFSRQRELLKRFLVKTSVQNSNLRVGAIVVSSGVGDVIPLTNTEPINSLLKRIQRLFHPQEGSRIDLGLMAMRYMFAKEGRFGGAKIGVIISDGGIKDPQKAWKQSRDLSKLGVYLISVGVGRIVSEPELVGLASTTRDYCRLEPLMETADVIFGKTFSLGTSRCKGDDIDDNHWVFLMMT